MLGTRLSDDNWVPKLTPRIYETVSIVLEILTSVAGVPFLFSALQEMANIINAKSTIEYLVIKKSKNKLKQ
ncbi:hypothetical protein MASR1M45_14300 [Candidatus Kapaibacterium sp.]